MRDLFCFLLIFGQIAAFVYFDPLYDHPQPPPVSEVKCEIKSIYGDSVLLHLPKKSG